MGSNYFIVTVLLLLNVSTRSVLGCRAYCKGSQVRCLKRQHQNNWEITWGKELAVQAQLAAREDVEQMQQLTDPQSGGNWEISETSATVIERVKHEVPDFAMRTEICSHYLQTYRVTIKRKFRGGKVGCGVDWNDTFIVVHCLYKYVNES
ncbi:uncharacterized protein LOC134826612 [Bolinopsis microptera]|uniref:uncharacterized protein LOC134826612 n=1 Tax=Bolinopsis microptera TaxID=2820187 RepID=UPI0030790D61